MRKEQFFHFRLKKETGELVSASDPNVSAQGGICIFARPIVDENIILWGVSKCHENDNYSKHSARVRAEGRAVSSYVRKIKGRQERVNPFGTVSPLLSYDDAKEMAFKIAERLHQIRSSKLIDISIYWSAKEVK